MISRIIKHLKQGTLPIVFIDYIRKQFGFPIKYSSLAYRYNKKQIQRGIVPEKYSRIIPYIPGRRILEIGAAEGVLSLLLAQTKEKVIALEMKSNRYEEALKLKDIFNKKGFDVNKCEIVLGNIDERYDLLEQVDTVVAVRVIYYLPDVQKTFANITKYAENVVLCGNEGRAKEFYNSGKKRKNYYATVEGMENLLKSNGYIITEVISGGDPIVVGSKNF